MTMDVLNVTADFIEAAVILASQAPPHGVHHQPKFVPGNMTKREMIEQGVETLLNDWRYQVETLKNGQCNFGKHAQTLRNNILLNWAVAVAVTSDTRDP